MAISVRKSNDDKTIFISSTILTGDEIRVVAIRYFSARNVASFKHEVRIVADRSPSTVSRGLVRALEESEKEKEKKGKGKS